MASQTEEHVYHPKDAVSGSLKTSMYTGTVGLFASAVQNTLLKQNVGPWGVFVRSGSTIGIMSMSTLTQKLLGGNIINIDGQRQLVVLMNL